MAKPDEGDHFDFIVVGAGSAGCVIAARLVERTSCRVLLLEAGGWDNHWSVRLPFGYYRAIGNCKLNWQYLTEPEPELGGRRIAWPRGRMVGGSSALNGLVFVRGQREDYDSWRDAGAVGWGWDDVLPCFVRLEHLYGEERPGRGRDGPVSVTPISEPDPLSQAFVEACCKLGWPRTEGFNGTQQEGAGLFELTTDRGLRASSSRAFVRPLRRHPRMRVETDSLCDRVLFEGNRATGVSYCRRGDQKTAYARREIILSCGSIGSPGVLARSGIGDREVLSKIGVSTIHHSPEVGRNLQDHFQARIVYRLNGRHGANGRHLDPAWLARSLTAFLFRRSGPLSIGAGEAGLFASTGIDGPRADVQVHFLPFSADAPGRRLHAWPGLTMSVCQLRPDSRGSIHIRSPDPSIPPEIYANYLSTPHDRQVLVAGIRMLRLIASAEPLATMIAREVEPGASSVSDADLLQFARDRGGTIFHPCGSCRMGPDAGSVTDLRLRVRGVVGLRVADTSIMPSIVSGNTNAAAMMIGERAADFLVEDN